MYLVKIEVHDESLTVHLSDADIAVPAYYSQSFTPEFRENPRTDLPKKHDELVKAFAEIDCATGVLMDGPSQQAHVFIEFGGNAQRRVSEAVSKIFQVDTLMKYNAPVAK